MALTKVRGNSQILNGSVVNASLGDSAVTDLKVSSSAAIAFSKMAALTVSRALVSSASGIVEVSSASAAEVGYLVGVTSSIQTQLGLKATDSLVVHLAGTESITGTKTFSADQTFFPAGTALLPSIAFTADPDSGLMSYGGGDFGLTSNGVVALEVVDEGLVIIGGNQPSGPQTRLELSGSEVTIYAGELGIHADGSALAPALRMGQTHGTDQSGLFADTAALGVSVAGAEVARFTDAGITLATGLTISGIADGTGTNDAVNFGQLDTKLDKALADGKVFIGNASDVATAQTLTGDVTVSNAGVTAIASGVIVNADISSSAAIAESKLSLAYGTSALNTSISNHISDSSDAHAGSAITNTPAGNIAATTVQAAINELDTEKLALAGGTMTGALILNADPGAALGAATKQYVDGVASGLDIHQEVLVATAAPLPSYNVAGANATKTLTDSTSGSVLVVDGVNVTVVGSRVLVKDQTGAITNLTTPSKGDNGIYTLTTAGVGGGSPVPWVLTRAAPEDASPSNELVPGGFFFVGLGNTNASTGWAITPTGDFDNDGQIELDNLSDWFTVTQFSGAGTYSAGNMLTLTGSAFKLSEGSVPAQIIVTNASNIPGYVSVTGDVTLGATGVTAIGSGVVTNSMLAGSIAYAKLSLSNSIVNADISSSAAIAESKLSLAYGTSALNTSISNHISDSSDAHAGSAITNTPAGNIAATTVQAAINELDTEKLTATLVDGKVFIGNASDVATAQTLTGDVTVSNAGVTAIASGVIVNADIHASAAIALSKLASGTSAQIVVANGSGVPTYVSMSGDASIATTGAVTISASAFFTAHVVKRYSNPAWTINGSNVNFSLAETPITGSEDVYLNGVLLLGGGDDYTLSGTSLTMTTAPSTGDRLLVSYWK